MVPSVSIKIPPDLVENVARSSCVLFLGADEWIGLPGALTPRLLLPE